MNGHASRTFIANNPISAAAIRQRVSTRVLGALPLCVVTMFVDAPHIVPAFSGLTGAFYCGELLRLQAPRFDLKLEVHTSFSAAPSAPAPPAKDAGAHARPARQSTSSRCSACVC